MGEFLRMKTVQISLVMANQTQSLAEIIRSTVLGEVLGQLGLPGVFSIVKNQPAPWVPWRPERLLEAGLGANCLTFCSNNH